MLTEQSNRALVCDHVAFIDDITTPLETIMRPATIFARYRDVDGRELVDVIFDHRPDIISAGHFADMIQEETEK